MSSCKFQSVIDTFNLSVVYQDIGYLFIIAHNIASGKQLLSEIYSKVNEY